MTKTTTEKRDNDLLIFLIGGTKAADLGLLPAFLDPRNPEPAIVQLDANYQHGGGWHPMQGFTPSSKGSYTLCYPGDPPFEPIAAIPFHQDVVLIYRYGIVAVFRPDGSFEVARMD